MIQIGTGCRIKREGMGDREKGGGSGGKGWRRNEGEKGE